MGTLVFMPILAFFGHEETKEVLYLLASFSAIGMTYHLYMFSWYSQNLDELPVQV